MNLISDADSTFLPEGGQPHQLLNAGLKLAALFCSRELRVLHVAGCGLVSNFLLDKLAVVAKCELSALARDQLYKIGLPGKLILRDYFQENTRSFYLQRH